MIFGTMNGQEPAAALLAGLGRSQPQLVGLSDSQLQGAAETATKLVSWFVQGVSWGTEKCKEIQSAIASIPGGWDAVMAALDLIPSIFGSPSGKDVHYYMTQVRNQTCLRIGVDIGKAPTQTPAPTSTIDKTKLIDAIKTTVTPIVATLQPATSTPASRSYPAGTVTARSSKTGLWRVAIPRSASAGLAGLGYALAGAADAPYVEVPSAGAPPPDATVVTETDLEKRTGQLPFYKQWQFWATVGGSVVVVSGILALVARGNDRHARDQSFARGDYGFADDDEHDDDEHADAIDIGEEH